MVSEIYTVVACPWSWRPLDADRAFHVSLFVAPRLTPDDDRATLADFDLFRRWGELLRELRVDLVDQRGPLDVRPVPGRFDPDLWGQMFPDHTPVKGTGVPQDWNDRPQDWRSFDARAVADLAEHHTVTAVASSIVDLPGPTESVLGKAIGLDLRNPGRLRWNDAEVTRLLDAQLLEQGPDSWADRGRSVPPLLQLHRLRRFYERIETETRYQEKPDPTIGSEPLPSPEPEFHERVTAAGDHPDLLRALGLVVDLEVADTARLRRATELTGRIVTDDGDRRCRGLRVQVRGLDDGALVSVAEGPDWSDGLLRVGNEEQYAVLDHDVDGSGLKTERFAYTLPRLATADARSRHHAAPPALRTSGLTVVRTNQAQKAMRRVERQSGLQDRIDSGRTLDDFLHTEDLMRGMRVEVWDDTAKSWHGLHDRVTTLTVGATPVLTGEDSVGFVQGTAVTRTAGVEDSPRYVHEAVFGWDGWSLSVERPGLRIRHDHEADHATNPGGEVLEKTGPLPGERPPHPFEATHAAPKGTLPRLRYGRLYAFRVFGVDLAGNSRPLPEPALRRLVDPESQLRRQLRGIALLQSDGGLGDLRTAAADVVGARSPSARSLTASVSRRALLTQLADGVAADLESPLVVDTRVRDAGGLHDLIQSAATDLSLVGGITAVVAQALDTTTRLTPFLRYEPVAPPVVVPRHAFTEGESQRVLVVRSGVRQDPDTLDVVVTGPVPYIASVDPALGYHDDCQRHLVPPKTTQLTAELHGKFDPAIGESTAARRQRMLTWALAEEGSLLDVERPDLDVPGGHLPQPGVALAANDRSVTPATLPLKPGEAPPTGQYVVHDTDQLVTPYLPDPMAAGISLVFPEAVEGIGLTGFDATEGFTTAYAGSWPKVRPIRLDLVGRHVLGSHRNGRVLTVGLPAGDLQRVRLSSSLRADELELMAVWRKLSPTLTGNPLVAEAAKDGWLWGLTPYDDVLLVHAVPRPIAAPRVFPRAVERRSGQTAAVLRAELRVHGSSTQSVTAEAAWTEHLDVVSDPTQPQLRPSAAVGFTVQIGEHDDVVDLAAADGPGSTDTEDVPERAAVHLFPDTKHRRVTYTFRATTRFREYFHPSLVAPDPDVPGDDGLSVVSEPVEVSIPSSARPAAPVVHSVVPLFRWESGTEAEQPMGWRHSRSTGVRIYLERPWYSSGEGELLGVLLARDGDDDFGDLPDEQSGYPFVSKLGADPIWFAPEVENRALEDVQLASLLVRDEWDDEVRPGRPVEVRHDLRLDEAEFAIVGRPTGVPVTVAAYRPQFNAERGLWYVDVAIDPWAHVSTGKGDRPQESFWPFLRLAVCRYQPESIARHHLSAPVRCRYVQLPPTRTTSVDRTDEHSVRVVVSGTVGHQGRSPLRGGVDPHRVVLATLSRRDPDIPTDLGWTPVATEPLTIKGNVGPWDVAWVGELTSPVRFPLRRPAPPSRTVEPQWRVTVEEWERFPGDPPLAGNPRRDLPVWEQRLVYADEFML